MPGFRRQRLHKRPNSSAPCRSISSNHDTDTTAGVNDGDGTLTSTTNGTEIAGNDNFGDGDSKNTSHSKNTTISGSGGSHGHVVGVKRAHPSSRRRSLLPLFAGGDCGCSRCPGGGGDGSSRGRKGRSKPAAALGISACVAASLLILVLVRSFPGDVDDRSARSKDDSRNVVVRTSTGNRETPKGVHVLWTSTGDGEAREHVYVVGQGDSDKEVPSGGGAREEGEMGGPLLEGEGEREKGTASKEGGGVAAAEVAGVKEEGPREAKQLSGTAKRCDDYQKEFGIVPDDSWGSAPKGVQEDWGRLKCDQVLAMNGFSFEDPPTRGRDRAVVVVWSNIRGWLDYLRPSFANNAREACPTECVFTSDRSLLSQADGVLFHGPTFQNRRDGFPRVKPPGVNYVFVNLEPRTYKPVQKLLRDHQLMSKFDLTMTYERSSDVPLGYVGDWPSSRYFDAPKPSFKEKDGFGSPDAVAAFVSNCKAAGATERFKYMQELMKHATVHSFGHCLHNREEPQLVPGDGATNRQENKVVVLARYKFLLAFENNNQVRDYVTEKVYNGLQSGTLPVYWGAENVEDFVPRGSVVKASDFSSPAELGKHLKMLAANEDAYEEYFKWRDDPEEEKRFEQDVLSRSAYGVNAMCRLCDRVLADKKAAVQ
eukprot:g10213.t1